MKTWHITEVVQDGEFEYWQECVIEARNPKSAEKKWASDNDLVFVQPDAVYQNKDLFDYRVYTIMRIVEACPCCHGTGRKEH